MKTKAQNSLLATFKLAMLALVVIAVSCSQETEIDPPDISSENLKAKAPKSNNGKQVTRPISGKIANFPDPDQDPASLLICNPTEAGIPLTRNILNGHVTHLGKLQPGSSDGTGSFGVPVSCSINEDFSEITSVYEVNYVAANGDEVRTVEDVLIIFNPDDPTLSTGTFEGTIEIVGGSGRFDRATGNMVFVGATFGPEGTTWEVVGNINY